ncbi:MAG: hypothetical protein QOG69_1122, partial [Actinomycetota bacterium]|nr:hypothetical protein [Actinomycetota bacterium]
MLAVSVMHDIDLVPTDAGALMAGVPQITVTLTDVAAAIR